MVEDEKMKKNVKEYERKKRKISNARKSHNTIKYSKAKPTVKVGIQHFVP